MMSKKKGFTLIELLISLAIVAIIATLGVNTLQKYAAKTKLRTAAGELAADFAYCRDKAKSEGRIFTITFQASSAASSYTISAPATAALSAFNLVKTPSAQAAGVEITGADFTGCTTVRLTQRGLLAHCGATPSPQNNSGTVSLTNNRGEMALVAVNNMVKTYVDYP